MLSVEAKVKDYSKIALEHSESEYAKGELTMNDICTDDRFEVIARIKRKLIESTNIETSQEEMSVLDNILFRMWQMGWTDMNEPVRHGHWTELSSFIGDHFDFPIVQKRCSVCRKWSGLAHTSNKDAFTFCPNCGARMDEKETE